MNHVQEIVERFSIDLKHHDIEQAVSLACSISKASLIEQKCLGDMCRFASTNHDPTDHIYWETRENVAEYIRKSNINIVHIIKIHKYACDFMTQNEIVHFASSTWNDVKSKILLFTEIMES